MKRGFAMILCICLLCLSVFRVQGTSIVAVESIEMLLTVPSTENRGSVCVIVGTWNDNPEIQADGGAIWDIDVQNVLYGDVNAVRLVQPYDMNEEINPDAPEMPFLLVLQPVQHVTQDGRIIISDRYHRVARRQGQFGFVNGELRGGNPWLIEEILADDPTIDTMDELAAYFEKRIDALQREGKLPPDPVDWPGTIGAAGGIVVVLGGTAAALICLRRKQEVAA